ncbi:MAG TPA: DUF2510 domain-containing protein [Acidimicrobiales bacterium]|nr:DUF2510 domain-containing protein [Acidimicrobiales bacterium]
MIRPEFPPPPLLDQGWYADPTGRYEARFWDGQKWTGHISHYGATGKDPIVRARLDRLWIRFLRSIVLWVSIGLILFFLIRAFWPDDISVDSLNNQSELESTTIQIITESVTLGSGNLNVGVKVK